MGGAYWRPFFIIYTFTNYKVNSMTNFESLSLKSKLTFLLLLVGFLPLFAGNILTNYFSMPLVLTLLSALVILSSIFIARTLANPIIKISKNIKSSISNNTPLEPIKSTINEVGLITESFNEFFDKFKLQASLMDNLQLPIMMMDEQFNINYINYIGAKIAGYEKESLIGQKCYDYFKTEDCNTDKCACSQAMKFDKPATEETIARPITGELPIMYTGAPIKNKDNNIIGAVEFITDITDVKEREEYLSINVNTLLTEMNSFAEGDLTIRVEEKNTNDEIGKLFSKFNFTVKKIHQLINSINDAVAAAASASTQISSSAEEMAAGAEELSSQTNETAAAVEQMSNTIIETATNASNASNSSRESSTHAKLGFEKVILSKEGMEQIVESTSSAGTIISSLAKKTNQIGEIAQVIDDIADQTNLLALNAAIEAARAGEQGRGFAVVADEVRKLAERTTKATKEIAETIKAIQGEAQDANTSMKEAGVVVEKGMQLTGEVEKVLQSILDSSENVSTEINQVASASEEQSSTAEEITKNVEAINGVTNETVIVIQQVAEASSDLNRLTENLETLVTAFKFNGSTNLLN